MASNTLELWSRLEKTDPQYTKPFSRGGGFKGTAINGTYIVRRLTEAFGPCGKGWRFVVEDDRIEDGHLLKSGDRARVHIIRGHIDYKLDGEWCSTSTQFGQTAFVDSNKNGTFTDEEAPKKSVTDCVAKCAVLLGIGADVHRGMFDDQKYVNDRKREEKAAKAAGAPEAANDAEATAGPEAEPEPVPVDPELAAKAADWAGKFLTKVREAKSARELDALEERHADTITSLQDANVEAWKSVKTALNARAKALDPAALLQAG